MPCERVTETAKKIRGELKKNFPGVKFSVTSKSYTGGSSVHIDWTDGPTLKQVDPIVKRFAHGYDWQGQKFFGPDYVFTQRELSLALKAQVQAILDERFKYDHWDQYAPYQWERAEEILRGATA